MEGLTKKQKGFVKDYIETGNGTQSALNNYNTEDENMAAVIASTNIRKDKIVNAIKSIAEQIPEEKLLEVHLEGLEAGKKVFKNNNESGEIEEVGYEPDYPTRHKYLDTAYKLKGIYAPERHLNVDVSVNLTPEALAVAKKYEEELNQLEDKS